MLDSLLIHTFTVECNIMDRAHILLGSKGLKVKKYILTMDVFIKNMQFFTSHDNVN